MPKEYDRIAPSRQHESCTAALGHGIYRVMLGGRVKAGTVTSGSRKWIWDKLAYIGLLEFESSDLRLKVLACRSDFAFV